MADRLSSNLLLAALPKDDRRRVLSGLDVVPLKLKQILYRSGETPQHVYFPTGGFCSMVTELEDGEMVEIATVGREGSVGVFGMLNGGPAPEVAMVQAASPMCYRMTAHAFHQEMDRRGAFHGLMVRYLKALVGVVMQSTACNAVHTVEQRLARWLLLAHDRVACDEFPLTQEFVAMMLGTTRPTVTIVAGTLQRAGLITYYRGYLTILDREKLESTSCECYRATTRLLNDARKP